MRILLMAAAAIALSAGVVSTADAQKLDKNGRCHDAKGHYAKKEVCAGGAASTSAPPKTPVKAPAAAAAPAVAAPAPVAAAPKKGQRCKNDKGKFAKCGTPGATPA